MTINEIPIQEEQERACGYRQEGGIYLVAPPAELVPCGILPVGLALCPTCGGGVHFSRGWTWINFAELSKNACCTSPPRQCKYCPLANLEQTTKMGLLWVGERTYKTPRIWVEEAERMGVSRRVSGVPRDFHVGEHWIALAHNKVIPLGNNTFGAAIFHAFRPLRMEYVCTGRETPTELATLVERGLTPVRVKKALPGADRSGQDAWESDYTED